MFEIVQYHVFILFPQEKHILIVLYISIYLFSRTHFFGRIKNKEVYDVPFQRAMFAFIVNTFLKARLELSIDFGLFQLELYLILNWRAHYGDLQMTL